MKVRRVFAHVVLAFLLLSQQLGITHAISHLSSGFATSSSQDKQLPGELQCEQCLAFAALGTGLLDSSPFVSSLAAPADPAIAVSLAEPLSGLLRAFDSRAPPAIS